MRKIYLGILIVIVAVVGLYLYLAYARIYNKIKAVGLKSADQQQVYMINNASTTKNLVYVALGDSLTAGVGVDNYAQAYPYLLAQSFSGASNVTLKNISQPGATTNSLITDLLDSVISAQPDIITLLIGVNDIHSQVSAKDFEHNYDYILQKLTADTKAKIYLINIPMIGSDSLMLPPYRYYYDYRTKDFNNILVNLAQNYNIRYLNLYSPTVAVLKSDGPHYSDDLFHPSALGYKSWAKIIYDNINQ